MQIRQVREADLQAVTDLEACCFSVAEAAGIATMCMRIKTFPSSFLVMAAENRIIAMINGCVCNQICICDDLYDDASKHKEDGDYQAVFGLDVHPDYQHNGYAIALMNAFIQVAKEQHRKGMILTCKKERIGFYEQFGYENMGISDSTHGGVVWYDMLLMFRSII